jgi:hypothetical protein
MPDPHTVGYSSLSCAGLQPPDPHHAGILAPQPCHWIHNHWDPRYQSAPDPSPEPVPQLTGITVLPPHLQPTALQALLSPSHEWDDWSPTPPIRPCLAPALCGTTQALPHWDRHHPGVRQPHPPACQEPHPLGRASPSSTGFPDNCFTRLLLSCHWRAPSMPKRHSQTGLDTKELKTTKPVILLFQNWWLFFSIL